MPADFFQQPILNSPYERPGRHWELDDSGQPTGREVGSRRPARFVSPIPQPKGARRLRCRQRWTWGMTPA